jgi:hypothetical protein
MFRSFAKVASFTAACGLLAVGCGTPRSGSFGGTPRAPIPVALDVQLQEVPCQPHVSATVCFTVSITNRGPARGGGSCQLFGETHRTSYPGDESDGGQVFKVAALAAGHSMTTSGSWQGTPRDYYRGICSPGLGS